MFPQVTIVGPGLLGASLAMALRARTLSERIVIWARNPERIEQCMGMQWCDRAEEDLAKAVTGSSVVVVCTSVASISSLVSEIMSHTSEGMIVTDVGSVKGPICASAVESARGALGRPLGAPGVPSGALRSVPGERLDAPREPGALQATFWVARPAESTVSPQRKRDSRKVDRQK